MSRISVCMSVSSEGCEDILLTLVIIIIIH